MSKRKLNNQDKNNKWIKSSLSFPFEIWCDIFEYYQFIIKINSIKFSEIRDQQKKQIERERFRKIDYVDRYSYKDIQNIALVNSKFYDYWYKHIVKLVLIRNIDLSLSKRNTQRMKFTLLKKSKLINLKRISNYLQQYYNINSDLYFMDNIKKKEYNISEKQYKFIEQYKSIMKQIKSSYSKKRMNIEERIEFVTTKNIIKNNDILSSIIYPKKEILLL